jgi:hypothetical protein
MPKKDLRAHLFDHAAAVRDAELTQVAILALERTTSTPGIRRVLIKLQAEQQKQVRRIDAAASAIGAPYRNEP